MKANHYQRARLRLVPITSHKVAEHYYQRRAKRLPGRDTMTSGQVVRPVGSARGRVTR